MIVQAGNVASNGMIHLINELMDGVSPIVQSDAQVRTRSRAWRLLPLTRRLCVPTGEPDEDHLRLRQVRHSEVPAAGKWTVA